MPEKVTPEQVKEILAQNGITSIEELARQLAEDQNSLPGTVLKEGAIAGHLERSWIIKVWRLDKKLEELIITELPNELGGNLIN